MYAQVQDYIRLTRASLQDLIVPYRYSDQDVLDALNFVMTEVHRIRPDIFLAAKYDTRLKRGDMGDYAPGMFTSQMNQNNVVPVSSRYLHPMIWYMSGYLQTYDVADTQDQRAQAFMAKFQQHLMSVSAG
jgi:hypothetical protein